jgi:hypothetical protein
MAESLFHSIVVCWPVDLTLFDFFCQNLIGHSSSFSGLHSMAESLFHSIVVCWPVDLTLQVCLAQLLCTEHVELPSR